MLKNTIIITIKVSLCKITVKNGLCLSRSALEITILKLNVGMSFSFLNFHLQRKQTIVTEYSVIPSWHRLADVLLS